MYRYEDLPALMTRMTGDEKHAPSATSTLDVLWTLYDRVLQVTPETVKCPDRNRFLLSKGHGPMALYTELLDTDSRIVLLLATGPAGQGVELSVPPATALLT